MLSSGTGGSSWVRILSAALLGMSTLSILGWMTGCDAEETSDSSPPDHIINQPLSQGKYRYGITDTIVIDFSERIDTAALDVSFKPDQGIRSRFKSQTRLLLFGTGSTSGTPHFAINLPFTVTLAGLKDLSGNGRPAITESFQPYAWVDRDFVETAYDGNDTLFGADSALWVDGTSLADSLVTEGRLDFNSNSDFVDRQDFKLIRLVAPDTVRMTLTCPKGVNLHAQWAGPFVPATLDSVFKDFKFNLNSFFTDSTKAKGSLSHSFNADYSKHDLVLNSPAAVGIYILRLSIPPDTEAFYRLGLRRYKLKK
jgi:hypothetical protein